MGCCMVAATAEFRRFDEALDLVDISDLFERGC